MTACKRLKKNKEVTLEDLYQNKNFVPPKEQNLETIFEEPKQTKNGASIFTSTRKYKRYLNFDPITGKVHKPKKKVKRCMKKLKGKTRSASKAIKNIDINALLETLSDSSDECSMDMTLNTSEYGESDNVTEESTSMLSIVDKTVNGKCEDKNLDNIELCKKCESVIKCCTCELNYTKLSENNESFKNQNRSSLKALKTINN